MRFSIVQTLMLVALVALLVVFWQSEPRGVRESRVGWIKFSPDGSKLAVVIVTVIRATPLGMRTAMDPGVHIDPTRDVFIIETASGEVQRALLCESIKGDWQRTLSQAGDSSMAFNPRTRKLAAISFVDEHVIYLDAESSMSNTLELEQPVGAIAFSKSGKWLACLDDSDVLTVFNARTLKQVQQLRLSGNFFGGGILFAPGYFSGVKLEFSDDETKVLVNVTSEIWEWDFMSSAMPTQIGPFDVDPGLPISYLETTPNGERIHCSTKGIVVTDGDGVLQKKLVGLDHAYGFSFSSNGQRFVFLQRGLVKAYGIGEDFQEFKISKVPARSVVISPDGKQFAVTVGDRKVALFDFETGKEIWQVQLPERAYIMWPYPAAGIVIWTLLAIEMYFRSRRSAKHEAEVVA